MPAVVTEMLEAFPGVLPELYQWKPHPVLAGESPDDHN